MPCDMCERGCMDDCGFEVLWWDEWTDCGTEYNCECDGYIHGDPGDYMIDWCKVRLGIHWLFNEVNYDK